MKKSLLLLVLIGFLAGLYSAPISYSEADGIARNFVTLRSAKNATLEYDCTLRHDGLALAFVWKLEPNGYIVVCADDQLPPVLAYSFESPFDDGSSQSAVLSELIIHDLSLRLQQANPISIAKAQSRWQALRQMRDDDFIQYPPAGYSPTGGWLKSNWTQNSPYNMYCPIDPVTSVRSVAGCPSVAMGMIVNFHETLNGTRLSDLDDYYHSYAGRNYWIDNDYEAHGFASFPQLNTYLDELNQNYKYQLPITNSDKGALVWASGVACRQVYTSSSSGTFSVSQANQAFIRFGFEGFELLTDSAPDLYPRMRQNMIDAKPVHLAVVTPAWDMGHNVVVDGYNTDEYYHLNFGWGGSYNGWYLLPSEIPYGLTVVEGAIVDINPKSYLFAFPETLEFLDFEDIYGAQTVELINITSDPIVIEDYRFPEFIGLSYWHIDTSPEELPYTLLPGQSMFFHVDVDTPTRMETDEIVEEKLRIIHADGAIEILVRFNMGLITSVQDNALSMVPMTISAYPNPFAEQINISVANAAK
ncbi:MAG: C10 family peptidase, partial [Candidatus Cloacimonadaceae bacterium]|nr:C10 family peptidase [Candidatus Cloacimonadaceae bacterium]